MWKNRRITGLSGRLFAVAMAMILSAGMMSGTGTFAKTDPQKGGDWVRAKNGKWWYQYSDGSWPAASWLEVNGKWYHFDKSGWMQTGWLKDGKDWYYLSGSGSMRTGWVKDGGKWYFMNRSGRMRTGWLLDRGKWYFLGLNGAMKTGEIKVKGIRYLMGEDGALMENLTDRNLAGDALSLSGLTMLEKIYEKESEHNKNVLISPVSVQIALGMAVNGADEGSKTQKELLGALMPGYSADLTSLNTELTSMMDRMTSENHASWNVANSVWAKTGDTVKLQDSYISRMKSDYGAEYFEKSFDNTTVQEINDWVKENTRNRIPKIIDGIDETVIFLINALAFDASWASPVDERNVEEAVFTNADGTVATVNMMKTHERRAILLDGGIGLIRPYIGGKYSFVAILPPENETAEDYLGRVVADGKSFSESYRNADTECGVNCMIPEFKVEYGILLNDTLKAMGVKDAFDRDYASFRSMITKESDPVVISKVIQKTMMQVDRKGTEAAAATVVSYEKASAVFTEKQPYNVILDRPFLYGIVDNTTGVPIFLGVQNCMSSDAIVSD